MYGACILSKLECICTKVGLYSKYIRPSACVLSERWGSVLKKTKIYKKRKIFIDQIIDILEKNEDYKAFVKTDERYKEMM